MSRSTQHDLYQIVGPGTPVLHTKFQSHWCFYSQAEDLYVTAAIYCVKAVIKRKHRRILVCVTDA